MDRRQFLGITVPATGAILLAPSLMHTVMGEINRPFTGGLGFDTYDVLVNGGGIRGYFAALAAKNAGKKVLLVERRSALGYEFVAKGRFWLGNEGLQQLPEDLLGLFMPEGEAGEVHSSGGVGPGHAVFGDYLTFMAGSLKKGLLRNLLVKEVDVLLMTDVCGLFADKGSVQGALLASKHGLHAVRCRQFLDVSDNVLFSRALLGDDPRPESASFVLEVWKTTAPANKRLTVPPGLGLLGNQLRVMRGKHADHQVFIEFSFDAKGLTLETVEHRARYLAGEIGKALPSLDAMFAEAQIYQFAWETGVVLAETTVPNPILQGHTVGGDTHTPLSCNQLVRCNEEATALVAGAVANPSAGGEMNELWLAGMAGTSIPSSDFSLSAIDEPGFAMPLQTFRFGSEERLKSQAICQVFVAGGGTAGSPAAIGAAERGASTIVTDFFHDLGGTKTMCGVMGYYHGYRDQVYFQKQEQDANRLAIEMHMSKRLGRVLYLLHQLMQSNGRFFGGAILCGAVNRGNRVLGGLICRYGKLEKVLADVSIDATGDGDLAAFAGSAFHHGDERTGKTQNYSQWDVRGAGRIPSHTNRDYDIIDNTRISEVQRALYIAHYEAHFYDFYPMMAVRESRRPQGVYELNVIDAVERTHFKDVLCLASSDFDPHYVGLSDYTRCGFLLPHSNDIVVEIPYRSIVPKTLDGLLLSGRGFSQTQEAYQFTRMTADLIVLGYLTGQIAATLSIDGTNARDFDVSGLQQEWAELGYFEPGYLSKPEGSNLSDPGEATRRVAELANGKREYLYACIMLPKAAALPLLKEALANATDPSARLTIAQALAWFGDTVGNDVVLRDLQKLFEEERKAGYPADFVDNYDSIRGRKHNVLEGLYWRINQHIALLARSRYGAAKPVIRAILEHTTSGGPMMKREDNYYEGRIDLKLVPFFNRILNLVYFIERVPDTDYVQGLTALLSDPHIGGYRTMAYEEVRWRVYGGDLELFLAAALARSGGKIGYELLVDYLADTHYSFKRFALAELQRVSNDKLGYVPDAWARKIASYRYPRQTVALGN